LNGFETGLIWCPCRKLDMFCSYEIIKLLFGVFCIVILKAFRLEGSGNYTICLG